MVENLDPMLSTRYGELFRTYGTGHVGPLINIKQQIMLRMSEEPELLRPDAAYFLLVNLDHMFIRPIIGAAYSEDRQLIPAHGQEVNYSVRLGDDLHQVTAMVLDTVSKRELPASSHDIMWAVEQNWNQINTMFAWC